MQRKQFTQLLNDILKPDSIADFCPNGLQVEGASEVKKIVTGVTASQALIDAAIAENADTILVHHGYFWKGESQPITGMKKRRIAALLNNDINLYGYHLPLDIHPDIGNNAQLANLLGIEFTGGLESGPNSVPVKGRLKTPLSGEEFADKIAKVLNRAPLTSLVRKEKIETIAWCTGGGQGYIDLAAVLSSLLIRDPIRCKHRLRIYIYTYFQLTFQFFAIFLPFFTHKRQNLHKIEG